jgi:hypothetical protein
MTPEFVTACIDAGVVARQAMELSDFEMWETEVLAKTPGNGTTNDRGGSRGGKGTDELPG